MKEPRAEYVDRRFGTEGRGFILYALGPVFFFVLFAYLLGLASRLIAEEGWGQMSLLLLAAVIIAGIFLVFDCLAVYEARRVVQKAEIKDDSVLVKPFLGHPIKVPLESIQGWTKARSFGYVPGVSVIDNNRSNIDLRFNDRSSMYLYGSNEADQWVESLVQEKRDRSHCQ